MTKNSNQLEPDYKKVTTNSLFFSFFRFDQELFILDYFRHELSF